MKARLTGFLLAIALTLGGLSFVQSPVAQSFLMRINPGSQTVPAIGGTGDPTTGIWFGTNLVGVVAHLASHNISGNAPALTSCGGGSPAVSGNDVAGEITLGTTATGCVLTFDKPYVGTPRCSVDWQTNLASMQYTVTNTALTLVQTSTSGNKVNYICIAPSGG